MRYQNKLNLNYQSKEEEYFSWWLDELVQAGYVNYEEYQPAAYVLFPGLKGKKKTILRAHEYTPDWYIVFKEIPDFFKDNLFIQNNAWMIDVKGTFVGRGNSSGITFPLNQKWMYSAHGILVEKVIPIKLFEKTFTPKRYLLTDSGTRQRKIKWKIKTL